MLCAATHGLPALSSRSQGRGGLSGGLSGGSSGGPWVQPLVEGDGPIFSVNSWGYTGQPGMAGPLLHDTSAGCLFGKAKGQSLVDSTTVANRGVAVTTCT